MRVDLAVLATVLGLLLGSMPIYAAGAATDPRRGGKGDWTSVFIGEFVQQWFYWVIRPVERLALAAGLGPLSFNLAGVGFGILAGTLLGMGRLSAAGWAILVGGISDIMDGQIARARGVAGPKGAFIDATLDRFAEVAVFVGLAYYFRESDWTSLAVSAALGGSLLVSYVRARGDASGVSCPYGLFQRAERVLLMGFGAILDPALSAQLGRSDGAVLALITAVIAVGTLGTAVFRTVWIVRRL